MRRIAVLAVWLVVLAGCITVEEPSDQASETRGKEVEGAVAEGKVKDGSGEWLTGWARIDEALWVEDCVKDGYSEVSCRCEFGYLATNYTADEFFSMSEAEIERWVVETVEECYQ
jgi:hypothetical protein